MILFKACHTLRMRRVVLKEITSNEEQVVVLRLQAKSCVEPMFQYLQTRMRNENAPFYAQLQFFKAVRLFNPQLYRAKTIKIETVSQIFFLC